MLANTRQNEICKIIKEKSAVTTAMLSEKFGVSVETIRKDLLFLEKRGELVRTRRRDYKAVRCVVSEL